LGVVVGSFVRIQHFEKMRRDMAVGQQQLKRLGGGTRSDFWANIMQSPTTAAPIRTSPATVAPANFGGISGFPGPTGGRQAVSKDGIILDLSQNSAEGPGVSQTQLFQPSSIGTDMTGIFNSLFVIADDDTIMSMNPGFNDVNLDSCGFFSLPIRGIQTVRIYGHRPFVFSMIFSAQDDPVTIGAFSSHQERWASQTITKTNSAGVADDYTYLNFSSSDGTDQMDPAVYGMNSIHTGAIAQKDWIVTAATNNVDVVVQELHVSGKTWANSSATGGGTPLTAADTLNLQMGSYSHLVRMGIRVQAAAAAAQTSAVTVQYRGYGGAF